MPGPDKFAALTLGGMVIVVIGFILMGVHFNARMNKQDGSAAYMVGGVLLLVIGGLMAAVGYMRKIPHT